MTFWRSLFTSRYTASLEQRVSELTKELAEARQQHREDVTRLTAALSPALLKLISQGQQQNFSPAQADQLKIKHKILKSQEQKSAACECGWNSQSSDPAELQNAIAEHHRSYFKPLQVKSRWTGPDGARARLEAESAEA
jgi:hypothetical protein